VIYHQPARTMAHRNPADRNKAVEWARSLIANPADWLILDTETTGLGLADEVIQIGILDPGGNPVLDSLLRPLNHKSIPAQATAVHGITIEMLAGAPTFPQIAAALAQAVGGKRVIAYNAQYDRRMFQQTAVLSGGRLPRWNWECAMIQYACFVGEWDPRKNDYRYKPLPSGDHTALGDCRATLNLIRKMAAAV